jgi:hypothetical protein
MVVSELACRTTEAIFSLDDPLILLGKLQVVARCHWFVMQRALGVVES